jgi:hypothetical protein
MIESTSTSPSGRSVTGTRAAYLGGILVGMSAAVGADIEALCSKCGDVWHVVVAKVGDAVVKVICKECGAQHRYKSPHAAAAGAKKASTPRTTAPRATREAPVERIARPQVAADLSKPPRTYRPTDKYEVGERVDHPTFGQGVVEAIDGQKVTIFFATGRKVLVHDKGGATPSGTGLARPKPFDHANPPAGGKPVNES